MSLKGFPSLCGEQQRVIVSEENHCVHRAHNVDLQRVFQYRVDVDVIKGKTACDFLLLNDDKKDAYLIELKGNKLLDSLKQLEATATDLRYELKEYTIYFRIPCKPRTHDIHGNDYKKFRQRHSGRVVAKRNVIEENI